LFGRADEFEQWDTIIHETCHLIADCPNGCDDFPMTVRKHRNLQSGRVRRICRKCRERIFWTGRVSEPTLQAAQSERPETC
jgi:predicted SprT family Zn-dependent metalloprotease